MAFKRSIATNILPLWKRKKPPQFTTEDGKPWRCGRAREFETLRHADCRVCIPLERSLGKRRPFLNYLTFLILFSSFSPQKRRNAALSCGISVVHLFCLHILVRDGRLELPTSCSQMCVGTFSRHSSVLFGPFLCLGSSSLELFCPACFKKPFRLLGFVWDWILCIKRCSARFEGQWQAGSPQWRGAGIASHKQRIKPVPPAV